MAGGTFFGHNFIDKYTSLDSFLHRLDPRTKFVTTLAFILAVLLTPPQRWQAFACYLSLILVLLFLSKLPPLYVLKRSLVILPFVIMVALFIPFFKRGEVAGSYNIWFWQVSITYSGLVIFWNVLVKAWLSVLSLILLTSTTEFILLLRGSQRLGTPPVMVMILSFMYRYIFLMADEAMRMKQARDSRSFGGDRLRAIKTVGNMIGTLFLRSYERGERVYAAMLARAFEGEMRTLHQLNLRQVDAYFGTGFLLYLIFVSVSISGF